MTHEIKLREEYADAVLSGDKCFEVRENDRVYQKGDRVRFIVIDKYNLQIGHYLTVMKVEYEITYVLSGWGLKENWVAFGIKPVSEVSE